MSLTDVTEEHLPFYVRGLQKLFGKSSPSLRRKTLATTAILAVAAGVLAPSGASADDNLIGFSNISFPSGSLQLNVTDVSAWDLVGSGYDLTQVDPLSGVVTGTDFGQTLSGDYALQADLMANNQMAIDAADLALQARQEAQRRQAAAEEAKKKQQGAASAGSSGADASGCPTSAPGGTLRNGAESVGIAEICARSVAQARSPEAAGAIKAALNRLGTPYSQPKRNQEGWADCSSYTTRAYQSAGVNIAPPGSNAPTTRSMRVSRWAVPISFSELRPGDLIQPHSGHVAMWLADGWIVHTNRPGDVSHVRKAYTSAYWAAYVDPSRV